MRLKTRIGLAVIVGMSAFGCQSEVETKRAKAPPVKPQSVEQVLFKQTLEPVHGDSLELVVFSSAHDSVYIERVGQSRHLVWQKRQGASWHSLWRSLDIYDGGPEVFVADVNEDGTTDLFWSLRFEEIIGGMFVLDRAGKALEVRIPVPSCQEPVLERDERGYLLRVFAPGVYSAGECKDMNVEVELCGQEIMADWPHFFRVVGVALQEERGSAGFYHALATQYQRDAERMDSLFQTEVQVGAGGKKFSELCKKDLPGQLRVLADSANRLAGLP